MVDRLIETRRSVFSWVRGVVVVLFGFAVLMVHLALTSTPGSKREHTSDLFVGTAYADVPLADCSSCGGGDSCDTGSCASSDGGCASGSDGGCSTGGS